MEGVPVNPAKDCIVAFIAYSDGRYCNVTRATACYARKSSHSCAKRYSSAIWPRGRMIACCAANTAGGKRSRPECMVTVLYNGRHPRTSKANDDQATIDGFSHRSDGRAASLREDKARVRIRAHAWPLPAILPEEDLPSKALSVLVAGERRRLPEAKHSSWLRDRCRLDRLKAEVDAHEVVLSETQFAERDQDRKVLLEGLTSNLFVVDEDGTVCTAPSGVLAGAMRQACISACEEEDIPVRLDFPDVSQARFWREAFLTGTRRVLAPIGTLLFLDDEDMADKTWPDDDGAALQKPVRKLILPQCPPDRCRKGEKGPSMAQRLRARMLANLEQGATRVLQ